MRMFGEADRKKKKTRIQPQELEKLKRGISPITGNKINPNNEKISQGEITKRIELADTVKASLKDGYLPCAVAFKIAKEAQVPKVVVGKVTDGLGIRITNCQIGCFKVDKTIHDNSTHEDVDDIIVCKLNSLKENNELTCVNVFDLAQQLKSTPMEIAGVANLRGLKIHNCQLGCF